MSRPRRVPVSARRPKLQPVRPSWDDVELMQMPDVTAFSDDPDIADAVYVVRMLKQHPQFLDPMRKELARFYGVHDPEARCNVPGPKRGEHAKGGNGDYLLLYFCFLLLRKSAMFALLDQPHALTAVWAECGFSEAPDYQTVRLRFIELGDYWESIGRGADQLIQHAKSWEPAIGRFIHVDACAFETQARLEHCCPRGVLCKSRERWWKRAPVDDVKEKRNEEAEEREPENDELAASLVPRTRVDDATVPAHLRPPAGLDERYAYFVIDGCLRRSFDPTVGLRIFENPDGTVKKCWLGGIGQAAVDALTGAPLAVQVFDASTMEHRHYKQLLGRVKRALGGVLPLAMTGDKGLSIYEVFRENAINAIASVIPWRKKGNITDRAQIRCDKFDEYGVPRCEHCGHPGDQLAEKCGMDFKNGKPFITFRCTALLLDECEGIQSIACEEGWSMLVALSRLHPLYSDLHAAHKDTVERVFSNWRRRYSVFGDDKTMRLKVFRSVEAQQLRAEGARFLEWFRICIRHGWLAGHKHQNRATPFARNGLGSGGFIGMLQNRRKLLLDLPYGAAAIRLGLKRAGPAPPGGRKPSVVAALPPPSAEIPF